MRDGLEAGDIIEMLAIEDRGILVEKTWTLATYVADMDYQFGYLSWPSLAATTIKLQFGRYFGLSALESADMILDIILIKPCAKA
jgi:hypothetical protein